MVEQIGKEKIGKDLGKGDVRTTIEIKPLSVMCNGLHHERIRWTFDPYAIFEIIKHAAHKSESELAVLTASPEEAVKIALKVINKKYCAKNGVILTWKTVGYSKTQQTLIRVHSANIPFKTITPEGKVLLDTNNSLMLDEMKAMTPQIKTTVITEEKKRHNNFMLQKTGVVEM